MPVDEDGNPISYEEVRKRIAYNNKHLGIPDELNGDDVTNDDDKAAPPSDAAPHLFPDEYGNLIDYATMKAKLEADAKKLGIGVDDKTSNDAPQKHSGPAVHFAKNNEQIVAELRACTSKIEVLNVMNKYHAYVIDGGRARIFREVNKYIQSLEISAFKGWCANKSIPITAEDPEGKKETKYVKLYDFW
jgi:hypothetical protein